LVRVARSSVVSSECEVRYTTGTPDCRRSTSAVSIPSRLPLIRMSISTRSGQRSVARAIASSADAAIA
jgi:hypothetical protein